MSKCETCGNMTRKNGGILCTVKGGCTVTSNYKPRKPTNFERIKQEMTVDKYAEKRTQLTVNVDYWVALDVPGELFCSYQDALQAEIAWLNKEAEE